MSETESGNTAPRRQEGGDPACWLANVCPECGFYVEDSSLGVCPRCGGAVADEE